MELEALSESDDHISSVSKSDLDDDLVVAQPASGDALPASRPLPDVVRTA